MRNYFGMKLKRDGDIGIRPAGKPDKCFYCDAPAPSLHHNEGCVIPQRSIVVEVTTRFVVPAVRDWNTEQIEFRLNESSYCADNMIHQMSKAAEARMNGISPCFCPATTIKYVREASLKDHEDLVCEVGMVLDV